MGKKQKSSTLRNVIDADPDRISCLPGHVIDQILSCLPIEEAVRTSVLSRKWKNKWYTLPDLVFDTRIVSEDPSIVDHVLLLHSGPINKFEISNYDRSLINENLEADIDRWILHIIKMSVKELVLAVCMDEIYKLPWCLFSCQSLDRLQLYSCWVKLPTMFEGLRNLKHLDMDQVTITQDALEKFISGCPLLESLTLTNIDNITQINVHAPNLKDFDVLGKFEDINFDNTFKIDTVYVSLSVYLNSENNQSRVQGGFSNLLKFFDRRPHIKNVEILNHSLRYLAVGVVPVKLPTSCMELEYLSLCINFDDMKEISAALCLFRSSPNLQKLEISAQNEEQTDLLTSESYCWEDLFSMPDMPIQVGHVTIKGITGTVSELDFIKFLLLYSPVLKKMIVNPDEDVTPELTKGLIRFKRASVEAEVILEDSE